MQRMRITFLGHVGLFVETRHGSVLCDPWFSPAYFGSWFPFPRNDDLDPERFANPDFLYVSHLHRDHFDPEFLARHVGKDARVLLPDFPVPMLERELRALGFRYFVATRDHEPIEIDGLEIAILEHAGFARVENPGDIAVPQASGRARVLQEELGQLRAGLAE